MDDVKPAPAAPKKALKYNKKSPLSFGLPLRDLTPEEVAAWVHSQAQYDEIIESKAYSEVEDTPAAPVNATPAADSGATDAAPIQEEQ